MKFGDLVKFRKPVDVEEAAEIFVVREMRGDRVLVAALGTVFSIVPTVVYLVEELEVLGETGAVQYAPVDKLRPR